LTGARVERLDHTGNGWQAHTQVGDFEGDFLINCAGLQCDRVSELAGERRELRIVPFRGEYYKLKAERQHLVRNLIYPVPDPRLPFLGVHLTRLIHGGIEAGPNAVLATAREGYRKTDFNLADLLDALTYKGFWRFLLRYRGTAWFELRRSLSRDLFRQSLQRLVPELQTSDLDTGGSGVRAQAISPQGEIYQDFCLVARPNALHVLSAPSPAATASLAIGAEIVSMIEKAA
jgi:L-2-hydroxyglutarate oxidase